MTNVYRDIAVGVLFMTGLWGFIAGQFIISTVLFAATTVLSNIRAESVQG